MTTVMLDTNVLISWLHYDWVEKRSPLEHRNTLIENSDYRRAVYYLINESPSNGYQFFTSSISVVEMITVLLRGKFIDFARQKYQLPGQFLNDRDNSVYKAVHREFNNEQLESSVIDLQNTALRERVIILPDAFPPSMKSVWQERHGFLLLRVLRYRQFHTQDAYIYASAVAGQIEELWTFDGSFRSHINDVRHAYSDRLSELVALEVPELFDGDLVLPKAPKLKDIYTAYSRQCGAINDGSAVVSL